MNNVCMSGQLGKEVKLQKKEDGAVFLTNTVCVREVSGKYTWVNIAAFDELATFIAESFKAGDYVIVQGRLRTRNLDKDGGQKYMTDVVAWRIEGV